MRQAGWTGPRAPQSQTAHQRPIQKVTFFLEVFSWCSGLGASSPMKAATCHFDGHFRFGVLLGQSTCSTLSTLSGSDPFRATVERSSAVF